MASLLIHMYVHAHPNKHTQTKYIHSIKNNILQVTATRHRGGSRNFRRVFPLVVDPRR